jgi:hypothetical protein
MFQVILPKMYALIYKLFLWLTSALGTATGTPGSITCDDTSEKVQIVKSS